MQEGEVRAQFRLLSDHLAADIAKASATMQQISNKGFGGGGGQGLATSADSAARAVLGLPSAKVVISKWSKEAVAEMKVQGRRFKSLRYEAMQDLARHGNSQSAINQMGAIAMGDAKMWSGFKGYGMQNIMRGTASPATPSWMSGSFFTAGKAKMESQKDRAKFIKDATFAMMPLFNPTSVWGNLFATRQIFSAFSGTKTGTGLMAKAGLSGTGGAALAAGGTVGVLLSVGLAIKALSKVMHESIAAYRDAPKLYAKAMTSGLGLKFVTKRTMLADIMGVSEQEVIKYGYAFQYLNPKIEWASAIMAKTNTNLTSVDWSFKIVGNDMKAMFATIANDAAPAMRKFLDGLHNVIEDVTEWYNKHKEQVALQTKVFGWTMMPLQMLSLKYFSSKGTDTGPAPQPLSFMKQLPASSWEKMGLVIGGASGGQNPATQTAHHTKGILAEQKKTNYYLARGGGAATFNLPNLP